MANGRSTRYYFSLVIIIELKQLLTQHSTLIVMKKIIAGLFTITLLAGVLAYANKPVKTTPPSPSKNFYDLSIKSLDGKSVIKFSDFKGKKVLCVNTASECGFTPQLASLEKLSQKYKDKIGGDRLSLQPVWRTGTRNS
jgi:hypothetical protein